MIVWWCFFLMWLLGYISEFEIVDDHRAGKIVVNLNGRLNKCGVISPRFDVTLNDMEKWTSNLLPSRQFGWVMRQTARLLFIGLESCTKWYYIEDGKEGGTLLTFIAMHWNVPIKCWWVCVYSFNG